MTNKSEYLIGHASAEKLFIESFKTNKLAHAWLLTGPKGIGKATFAYHAAKFILANKINEDNPNTIVIDQRHPVAYQVSKESHGDLLVIEKAEGKKEIAVEEIRKIGKFLHLTSAQSSYRIVIIDNCDDLNINSANALLKILEEPPLNSLLLLISNTPGKLLSTIRSRCKVLRFKEPTLDEGYQILKLEEPELARASADTLLQLSNNSPGLALSLHRNNGLQIYSNILNIISKLPLIELKTLNSLISKDSNNWQIFAYIINHIILNILKISSNIEYKTQFDDIHLTKLNEIATNVHPSLWVELADQIRELCQETEKSYLDENQMIIVIFNKIKNVIEKCK